MGQNKEDADYEAHQDIKYEAFTEHSEKGRMRRVPDFMSVGMQDQLYGRQPDL